MDLLGTDKDSIDCLVMNFFEAGECWSFEDLERTIHSSTNVVISIYIDWKKSICTLKLFTGTFDTLQSCLSHRPEFEVFNSHRREFLWNKEGKTISQE